MYMTVFWKGAIMVHSSSSTVSTSNALYTTLHIVWPTNNSSIAQLKERANSTSDMAAFGWYLPGGMSETTSLSSQMHHRR